jgi:hypothetical protein
VTVTVCRPVAPSGTTSATFEVCTFPSASVARTRTVCEPFVAGHAYFHCRQVSAEMASASVASCHGPSSICTCTALTPTCCDHATPAIATVPAATWRPAAGTSMRDDSFTGPRCDQPRSVQYEVTASKRVTFSSTTHLVADT